MSAVIAAPKLIEAAATDLSAICSSLDAAHIVAAPPTLSVLPAAADEVSAGIARLFSGYAQDYQKLAAQAAASYEKFVQQLTASAGAYASAEAANVASLLQPLAAIAAPVTAASTGVPELLLDLVTNTQIFLGSTIVPAIGLLAASIFFSWLIADLAVLLLAVTAINVVTSLPFYGVVSSWLNLAAQALAGVTSSIFAAFPMLGQLASTIGIAAISAGIVIFWPALLVYLLILTNSMM